MHLVPITAQGGASSEILTNRSAMGICGEVEGHYKRTGYYPPWIGYLAVRNGESVGTCAFKTPPVEGRVEIAYFTFPGFEGKGIATEMAMQLISIAREEEPGVTIVAQTRPETNASTAILEKLGFNCEGVVQNVEDGVVWEWHLPPEDLVDGLFS